MKRNDYYPFGMLMPGRSKFETETTETKDVQSCISCSGLQGLISDYFKSIADNAMAGSGSEAAMLSYMQGRLQTDGYTYTTQQILDALNTCNNGWQKNVALRTLGIAVFGGSRLVFHTENFSVEGWVYNNLNDNQMHSIISSMGYLAGTYSGYSLYLRDGHVYWQLADGYKQVLNNQSGLPAEGGSAQCRTVSTISSNQWHHIVAVRVGNNALDFKIYVDGVLQQIEVADYAAMTNGDIYSEYVNGQVLTAYGDGVYNWGFVKNIRVYRKVITDAEAAANYSSCTGAPTDNTGLLVWGKFDEGTGTVAVDHSPYAIDGEIRQYQWHGGVGDAVSPGCITQNESVLCKTTTVTVPKVQGYRYGFNGKENDNEVKGIEGSQQDYGMRIYDPRVGRFLSVDPIANEYPELTPYQFASNRPIEGTDLDGLEFKSESAADKYFHRDPLLRSLLPAAQPTHASAAPIPKPLYSDNLRAKPNPARIPSKQPEIHVIMPNFYGNGSIIGPESVVRENFAIQKQNYYSAVGENIASSPTGSLGYLINGDRGASVGAAVGQVMFSFGGVPGEGFLSKPNGMASETSVPETSSPIFVNTKTFQYKYAERVRERALEDPVSHNFPYSFDNEILATKPIPKKNGYQMFQLKGTMNNKEGVFEIGVTKDKVIDHRFFRPLSQTNKSNKSN